MLLVFDVDCYLLSLPIKMSVLHCRIINDCAPTNNLNNIWELHVSCPQYAEYATILFTQSISHKWTILANRQYSTYLYTLHSHTRLYLIHSSHCYLAAVHVAFGGAATDRPTVPINRHRTRPDHDHVTRHCRSVCFDISLSAGCCRSYACCICSPFGRRFFFFSFLSISLSSSSSSFRFVQTPMARIVSLCAACELIRPHEVDRITLPNAYSYSRHIHSQTYRTEAFRFEWKLLNAAASVVCCCFVFCLFVPEAKRSLYFHCTVWQSVRVVLIFLCPLGLGCKQYFISIVDFVAGPGIITLVDKTKLNHNNLRISRVICLFVCLCIYIAKRCRFRWSLQLLYDICDAHMHYPYGYAII